MEAAAGIALAHGILGLIAEFGPDAYAAFERIRKSDPKRPIEQVLADWLVNAIDTKALEDEIKARHGVAD